MEVECTEGGSGPVPHPWGTGLPGLASAYPARGLPHPWGTGAIHRQLDGQATKDPVGHQQNRRYKREQQRPLAGTLTRTPLIPHPWGIGLPGLAPASPARRKANCPHSPRSHEKRGAAIGQPRVLLLTTRYSSVLSLTVAVGASSAFRNSNSPFLASTTMRSFSLKRPSSICSASGFSTYRWMALRSGRAP